MKPALCIDNFIGYILCLIVTLHHIGPFHQNFSVLINLHRHIIEYRSNRPNVQAIRLTQMIYRNDRRSFCKTVTLQQGYVGGKKEATQTRLQGRTTRHHKLQLPPKSLLPFRKHQLSGQTEAQSVPKMMLAVNPEFLAQLQRLEKNQTLDTRKIFSF